MNCVLSGITGIAMLGASFATMTASEEQHQMLRKHIDAAASDAYDKIVIERRNLYFQGLIIGALVSYFAVNMFKPQNTFHAIAFFLAITPSLAVIYYFLMPKSDWMLNHVKTPEATKAWLEVYKNMQSRYFTGMIVSTLAAVPIAVSLCRTSGQ